MSDISIELEGFAETDRALAALAAHLTDLRPFWPLVVPLFVGWMREQFETEGAYGGDPWDELTPAYAAEKTRRHPGKGLLVATGDLRKAASLPKRRTTPTSLELTIDDSGYAHGGRGPQSVAGFHQDGTSRMPARPLLFDALPHQAEDELVGVAEEYIRDTVRRLGLR